MVLGSLMIGSSVLQQASERINVLGSHANRAIGSRTDGSDISALMVHPLHNASVIGDAKEIERSQAAVKGSKGADHGFHTPHPTFQHIHGLLHLPGRATDLAGVACSDRGNPMAARNDAP